MNDLTDIFMPPTDDSDPAAELDRELATAGQVLQKLAEVEGIDIDSLGEQDVADLLTMLHGEENAGVETHQEQTKEASNEMSETITNADVAVELAKVASANGIDLNDVTREDYHVAFDALAGEMSDPAYFTKQAEDAEKLADAEGIGRFMAQAFMDELNQGEKVADMDQVIKGDKARYPAKQGKPFPKSKAAPSSGLERTTKELGGSSTEYASHRTRLKDRVADTADSAGTAVRRGGRKVDVAARRFGRMLGAKTKGGRRALGYGIPAATLAALAGGTAYGVSKKAAFDESFEQDATNFGLHLLMEAEVIEPVEIEFSKFAEYSGEEYDEAVEARAYELLGKHGWLED